MVPALFQVKLSQILLVFLHIPFSLKSACDSGGEPVALGMILIMLPVRAALKEQNFH